MTWQMSCPRCGTWKEWRRHDICSTCKAGTDVTWIDDDLTPPHLTPPHLRKELPMLPVKKGKIGVPGFSKAAVAEAPAVPSQAAEVAAPASPKFSPVPDYQKRCESRLDDWLKCCAE